MGKQIFIVDDDAQTRILVALILRRHDFGILEAYDAPSTVQLLESGIPDLFILDIMMPGMDGLELCRYLRRRPDTSATPIVVFTASGDDRIDALAVQAGADACVPKTRPPQELTATIFRLLDSSASPRIL